MTDQNDESNLEYLLKNMQPVLEDDELVFCSLPRVEAEEYMTLSQSYTVEREGITLVLGRRLADLNNLPYELVFKRITLSVYSSLSAVGFLARITYVLAAQNISVNVISAFHHDHLYILSDQAEAALKTLQLWQDKLTDN
ncbi:MAG: ACT domain-containing protein [Chloroflexi bacterium]|nr:ACT domain-containing protein [Chloroflexota bacterium]